MRHRIEALVIMADPLSLTASTIAVIGIACQSSKLLLDFFRTVSDAPTEIQHHIASLHALSSTFMGIQALGQQMPPEYTWSPEFEGRLKNCVADFQGMLLKMEKLCGHLEKGRIHKTWARLKWSFKDQYLENAFTKVQTYYITFSLELLTMHMYDTIFYVSLHSSPENTLTYVPIAKWAFLPRLKVLKKI